MPPLRSATELRAGNPRIEVEWIDSGSESGWVDEEEVLAKIEREDYLSCLSIGYLIHEDENRITIAPHLAISGRTGRNIGDPMTIPKVAIVERRELRR